MKSITDIVCPHCEQFNDPQNNDSFWWVQKCFYCKEKISVEVIKEEGIYYYSTQKYKKS